MKRPKYTEDFKWDNLTIYQIAEKYGLSYEEFREYRLEYADNDGCSNGIRYENFHYFLMSFCEGEKFKIKSDCLSQNFG